MMEVKEWSRALTAEEYVYGLRAIENKINEKQKNLLIAHFRSPLRRATTKDLSQAIGVKGHSAVILYYVNLAKIFCDVTGEQPDIRTSGPQKGKERWWAIWSKGWREDRGYIWELLPQVAEAIEIMEWIGSEELKYPDELLVNEQIFEGAVRKTIINSYERNPKARKACIEHYGSSCAVCGFDFGKTYGLHAKGYIHVHHIVPLAEVREEYEVDSVKDLRPVCPNCHSMLHLSGSCSTIDEVRSLMVSMSQNMKDKE